MNRLKITTNGYDNRLTSVVLNGEEISYKISGLTLQMEGGKIPKAIIKVPLSEVEIDGDFEVLKKVPEEKNNKEIIHYCEFSYKWIKENAKKIMGNVDINIKRMNLGIVKIKVNCEQEDKYNKFKNFISENKPLGVTVLLERYV